MFCFFFNRTIRPSVVVIIRMLLCTLLPVATAADLPEDPTIEQARTAIRQGQSARAFLLLQQILAEHPTHTEANKLLATARSPVSWTSWLAMDLGQDSNIAATTNATTLYIPALNRIEPVPDELHLYAIPSTFLGISGGANMDTRLTRNTHTFLSVISSIRYNENGAAFLPHHYDFAAGLTHRTDAVRWLASVSLMDRWLARYRLLNGFAATGQATFPMGAPLETTLTLEWRETRFPLFDQVRTQGLYRGLALLHIPSHSRISLLSGDDASESDEKSLDRTVHTLEASSSLDWYENMPLRLSTAWSQANYWERSPLFLIHRRDTTLFATIELDRSLGNDWFLTPRIVFERNQSNIPLMHYTRRQWSLTLRKEFRR